MKEKWGDRKRHLFFSDQGQAASPRNRTNQSHRAAITHHPYSNTQCGVLGGSHWVLHTGGGVLGEPLGPAHRSQHTTGVRGPTELSYVHGLSFHYGVNSRWAGMVSYFEAVILDQIFPETASEARLGWFWGAVPL